jgi:hypothetical protein
MKNRLKTLQIFALLAGILLPARFVLSAAQSQIIINEIAWMGTKYSSYDEWIELYNDSNLPINLSGWILKAADGSPEIKLTGDIPANSFYLLERTDDNTVIDIPADQIYTGTLSNKGEKLELYDNFGNLIDYAAAGSGWPAGNNQTKQTMERKADGNWQTSKSAGGTPKAKNSLGEMPKEPETSQIASGQTNTSLPPHSEVQKQSPSLIIFLSAALTAIFSGTAIFFLKRNFPKT